MKRTLSTVLLASAMAGAGMLGAFAPSVARADDDKPCNTKKFEYSAVEKACKEGGQKAAKDVMKAALKKAKADGKDWKCTHCHENIKTYDLKDNAVDDLKPYI